MKNKVLRISFLVLICTFCLPVFSQGNSAAVVVSPVPGVWANCQPLIVHVPEGSNVFYSFTGSDPLQQGFAYDGPVLIEKTGDITLRLVTVTNDNTVTEQKIKYKVNPVFTKNQFLKENVTKTLIPISSEKSLDIPEELLYCVGDYGVPYIKGQKLTVGDKNGLSRIVSLQVKDQDDVYRFMAQILPSPSYLLKNGEEDILPFTIECDNWENFKINVPEYCFISLDNQEWQNGILEYQLERDVSHTLAWKNLETTDSDVLIIPPKPELLRISETGKISDSINLMISDPRYTFCMSRNEKYYPVNQCRIDTIYGDDMAGTLEFSVFFQNIYQGKLDFTVAIDKKPPLNPVFHCDFTGIYARKPLDVNITSDGEVYYKIITPVLSDFGFNDRTISSEMLFPDTEKDVEFEKLTNAGLKLPGSRNGAVYYKVEAYAKDFAGNQSEISSYSVVVDPYNYYVVAHSVSTDKTPADGSPARPYNNLEEVINMVNETPEFVRIHIDGSFMEMPSLVVKKECELIGTGGSRIEFLPNCGFMLDNAKLTLSNVIVEQNNGSAIVNNLSPKTANPSEMFQENLFTVNNGALFLTGCEIVGMLGLNGTVIKAQNSILQIIDTGITTQTAKYAALFTGMNCTIDVNNSRMVAIAPTAVCFTVNLGNVDIRNSSCNLIADLGRIGEASRTDCRFSYNKFSLESSKKSENEAIWIDGRSRILENEENEFTGFASEVSK